jgi:hypothetical protein
MLIKEEPIVALTAPKLHGHQLKVGVFVLWPLHGLWYLFAGCTVFLVLIHTATTAHVTLPALTMLIKPFVLLTVVLIERHTLLSADILKRL